MVAEGTRLWGRDAERARLNDWLERVSVGQGGFLLMMGEPGAGKTTLMREATQEADERALLVFDTWCRGDEWEPAWYPLAGLMEQVLTAFEQHPQVEPFRQSLQTWLQKPAGMSWHHPLQFARLIRPLARSRPFLLCLDDLHLAGESLLKILNGWLPIFRQEPIGILACARSTHPNETLHLMLQETVQRGAGEWLRLSNLDSEDVARFLEANVPYPISPEAQDALFRLTHGNPLFLNEVLSSTRDLPPDCWQTAEGWEQRVPQSLKGTIVRRLQSLPETAREELLWMSSFEGAFRLNWIEQAAGTTSRKLARAMTDIQATGWLEKDESDNYRWSHPLVREVIYKQMNAAERAYRHRQIAGALEQSDLPEELKLLHWMKAQPDEQVMQRLWEAREQARSQYASRFRLELLDACLQSATDLNDPQRRIQVLCERPHVMFVMPEGLLRAQEATRQAIAELERHPEHDPELTLWVQMQCALAGQTAQLGAPSSAREGLQQVLSQRGKSLNPQQRAMLQMTLAYIASAQGDFRSAISIQRELWNFITDNPEWARHWVSTLRYAFHYALMAGDIAFAKQILERLSALVVSAQGSPVEQEIWHTVRAEWAWFQGQGAELQYHARLALETRRLRSSETEPFQQREWSFHTLLYRDPLQALHQVDVMLQEYRHAVGREQECLWLYRRAILLREGAQWDDMSAALRESLRLARHIDHRLMIARCLLMRADAELEDRQTDQAALTLLQAEAFKTDLKLPEISIEWSRVRSKLLQQQGALEEARQEAGVALKHVQQWGHALYQGFAHLQRASVEVDLGHESEAKEHLEQAEAKLLTYGEPREWRQLRYRWRDKASDLPSSQAHASSTGWALQARLLGATEIRFGNQPMEPGDWVSPKARAVCCHLILLEGKTIHAETLQDLHWQHLPEEKAKVNLQTTISAIRRSLRKAFSKEAGDWIQHSNGLYRWEPNLTWRADTQAFEQSAQTALQTHLPDAQKKALQHALSLYGGPLLPEFALEEWCLPFVQKFQTLYAETLLALANLCFQSQEYRETLHNCQLALSLDSCDEQACRLAMQSYLAQDQRADAIQLYERFKQAMMEELGDTPPPTIQRLYESIRGAS